MGYSEEEKEKIFEDVFESIENGLSLRKALINVKLSSRTFYKWLELEGNEDKVKQYARACEERAEFLLDEMLDIVDDSTEDYLEMTIPKGSQGGDSVTELLKDKRVNNEVIQRSRLRYDARKWLISKLNPKKYSDKVDVTSGGEKIATQPATIHIEVITPIDE